MMTRHFFTLLLVTIFLSAVAGDSKECVYTFYVQTGSIIKAGTDSRISATFSDSMGKSVSVPELREWGLMGPQHNYFETGKLDIFTGRGPCIGAPICRLNLTSDGSGAHHGWFCEYVEITSTGPHKDCRKSMFYVYQWLATDAPPYQLTAVLDGCKPGHASTGHVNTGPFEVGKPIRSASA